MSVVNGTALTVDADDAESAAIWLDEAHISLAAGDAADAAGCIDRARAALGL